MFLKTLLLGSTMAVFLTTSLAMAEPMDKPTEVVVLTVSGKINETNVDGQAVFDMKMFDALPQTTFVTNTIWTKGKAKFSGVLLKDVLDFIGSQGSKIRAIAINDYSVEIPASDAIQNGPIIATRMDGEPMSVRDKGPLWIVYPFDSQSKYRSETIYSRSIWQLGSMHISE